MSWQDSYLTRVEILGLIERLNGELLSNPSATLTLERWCRARGLPHAKIVARIDRHVQKPLDAGDRERLGINTDDELRYRHVRLFCGDKLLSVADNWYIPDRLTAEVNRLLDETDMPFGRVVGHFDFRRETLKAKLLWSPLDETGGELADSPLPQSSRRSDPLARILEHRAILRSLSGTPLSLVAEVYTRDVLILPLARLDGRE